MKAVTKIISVAIATMLLSACSSDGTSSSGGDVTKDASSCVARTLRTLYTNECEFDINAIILEPGANFFRINANRAETRSESGNSFGACRVPSEPILSADSASFICS